jgi:hypothetical protein
MNARAFAPLCLLLTTAGGLAAVAGPKSAAVTVTVDTSEAPDVGPWAARAKALVETWHPRIADFLKTDGFTPSATVKLVFKKGTEGIAGTTGDTIFITADWIRRHPDDLGMVIHELTHVIQSYPQYDPSWLVEGIADYVRFFRYEPRTKLPPIDRARASYRDGYKTTAAFLAWVERRYDRAIVRELNRALRRGRYTDGLFKERTGRTLDQLWAEFVRSMKRK